MKVSDRSGPTHCHRQGGCIRAFDDDTCGEEGQCSILVDIMASQALPPDGEAVPVQCCVCGKTGLSTVEGDGGTECQLHDGRWTCSQDCYYTAVDCYSAHTAPNADRSEGVTWEMIERYASACVNKYADMQPPAAPSYDQFADNEREVEEARSAILSALSPSTQTQEDDKRVGEDEEWQVQIIEQSEMLDGGIALTLQLGKFDTSVVVHFGDEQ